MSLADDLRTAGVIVIEGRPGRGRPGNSINVVLTNTGKANEGADDINNIVMPAGAMAYIERSGRVWLLADGPLTPGDSVVYVAAYKAADQTEEQDDAVAVLTALIAPDPVPDKAEEVKE